jgi:hypothetical protein
VINEEELSPFTVESDAPEIAEMTQVSEGSSTIRIEAHASGRAKLILRDRDSGEVIDRFTISAQPVESIELATDDVYEQRFTIVPGGESTLYLHLSNDGDRLVGIGGVDFAFSGGITEEQATLVSAIVDTIVAGLAGTSDDYISIETLAVGSGSITATAVGGGTLEIPVAIVEPSDVTTIQMSTRSEPMLGHSVIIDARSLAGDETVHEAPCAWHMAPSDGPIQVEWEGSTSVQVAASAAGTATIRCTVGNSSQSLEITFQ